MTSTRQATNSAPTVDGSKYLLTSEQQQRTGAAVFDVHVVDATVGVDLGDLRSARVERFFEQQRVRAWPSASAAAIGEQRDEDVATGGNWFADRNLGYELSELMHLNVRGSGRRR